MGKETVRNRIFKSNTWMVIVTLFIFLVINLTVVRIYSEIIEREFKASIEQTLDEDVFERIFADFTIKRNDFILLILVDGILCITVLVLVSRIFTKHLVNNIMKPLNLLSQGAVRIKNNDLTYDIDYEGDTEFEEVCGTFNSMRRAILAEKERNQKYEKSRTDMIAGISHDLRTPLTAIRGTVKGLLDGIAKTPEQQEKFLITAYRRTGEMDVLLKQLFYLSKLETGNMPLELSEVEPGQFIYNYVVEKKELISDENILIETDITDIEGKALIDREQFIRILDNLFENSRKYAKSDPLVIRVVVKQSADEYRIVFSDNGIGIPKEKMEYIFDEFYRADESRNATEGSGLGLYIVRGLVEAMGGTVSAQNENGLKINITLKKI